MLSRVSWSTERVNKLIPIKQNFEILFLFLKETMMANKRKRPSPHPPAQDWPPTSEKKKTLIPFGRPKKLPRLDEAPYFGLYLRMMHHATEEHRARWKRMGFFRRLHYELLAAVPSCPKDSSGPLVRINRRCRRCRYQYERERVSPDLMYPYRHIDIAWVTDLHSLSVIEKLSWVAAPENFVLFPTRRRAGQFIFRYSDCTGWVKNIRDELDEGVFGVNLESQLMPNQLRVAPKNLSYKEARNLYHKIFERHLGVGDEEHVPYYNDAQALPTRV